MKVMMKALREFPLAEGATSRAHKKDPTAQGGSRRIVQKGEEYEINSSLVEFHESTQRGKRVEPLKRAKTPATVAASNPAAQPAIQTPVAPALIQEG